MVSALGDEVTAVTWRRHREREEREKREREEDRAEDLTGKNGRSLERTTAAGRGGRRRRRKTLRGGLRALQHRTGLTCS